MKMASSQSSPRSIGQTTSECIASLRQLGAKLRNSEGLEKPRNEISADLIGDFCDRLSLWSQDVGAQDGRLEGLLAQSSSLRTHTSNLLVDLTAQISEITSIEDEDEDAIEEINDIIGSLFHLEPALIDPAPLDRCLSSSGESWSLSSAVTVASEDSHSHKPIGLTIVTERRRTTSEKPDVDIIAVSGFFGLSSWLPDDQLYHGELTDTWLATLLPDILEENGIYARILSFTCKPPRSDYKKPLSLTVQANELVKQVSTERITDPARPLFFLSHSFGGILAKQAICTLIDEGLSVNTTTPVCGCLFFSVPHDVSDGLDSALNPWFLSLFQSSLKAQLRRWGPQLYLGDILILQQMVIQVNEAYKKKETQYNIPAINYFEPSCRMLNTSELLPEKSNADVDHSRVAGFSRDQREYILPVVHRIATIVESASLEWQYEMERDFRNFPAIVEQHAVLRRQRENPFAMLAGYNTALLINDCLEMLGPKWGAVVDIVRDLVDVITDYDTEDVDIQLSHQVVRSFSVKDGMQASKLLSRVRPAGNQWNFKSQLDRYIAKYLKSKSSRLANGNLRPVNMIILTTGAPPGDDSSDMAWERIADRSESEPSLDLRMQFVQLEDIQDSFIALSQNSNKSGLSHLLADQWAACLQRLNKSQISALNIAPIHSVFIPYISHAAICQRILLGAITNRFHEVPALSDHDGITAIGTDTMSVSADTESVTDAGRQKPVGGAFSYPSSITSGDIHMMDEAENKPQRSDEEFLPWQIAPDIDRIQETSTVGIAEPIRDHFDPDSFDPHSWVPPNKDSSKLTVNSTYPMETGSTPRRSTSSVQKDQATFQCTLCPKKFTRAYNLHSHLRTHTDDRPFICSVCNKAFARQHDRKRHEGLHSQAKKLVCRGELPSKAGQTWGCGRRFARAEALGRHFRSEAGQTCIKPLLDEEKAERQRQTHEIGLQSLTVSPYLSASNLPAALVIQYPALANIDWTAVEPEKVNFDPGELSDINATEHGYTEDER